MMSPGRRDVANFSMRATDLHRFLDTFELVEHLNPRLCLLCQLSIIRRM